MGFLELDYRGVVVFGNSEISSRIPWRAGQTGIAGLQITFPDSIGLKCDLRFPFLCSNDFCPKRKKLWPA